MKKRTIVFLIILFILIFSIRELMSKIGYIERYGSVGIILLVISYIIFIPILVEITKQTKNKSPREINKSFARYSYLFLAVGIIFLIGIFGFISQIAKGVYSYFNIFGSIIFIAFFIFFIYYYFKLRKLKS